MGTQSRSNSSGTVLTRVGRPAGCPWTSCLPERGRWSSPPPASGAAPPAQPHPAVAFTCWKACCNLAFPSRISLPDSAACKLLAVILCEGTVEFQAKKRHPE